MKYQPAATADRTVLVLDASGPAAHRELVRRGRILVSVQREPTIALEIAALRRAEDERVQPLADDPDVDRMDPWWLVAANRREQRLGDAPGGQQAPALGSELGGGGFEIGPGHHAHPLRVGLVSVKHRVPQVALPGQVQSATGDQDQLLSLAGRRGRSCHYGSMSDEPRPAQDTTPEPAVVAPSGVASTRDLVGGARTFALLALTIAGLVGGLILTWTGHEDLATWVWAVPAVIVGVRLVWSIVRDLLAGAAGVDVIAVLAIAGALALGETFAAAVIAVMLATGEALETYAAGRAQRELTALLGRAPQDVCRYRDDGLEVVPIGTSRWATACSCVPARSSRSTAWSGVRRPSWTNRR